MPNQQHSPSSLLCEEHYTFDDDSETIKTPSLPSNSLHNAVFFEPNELLSSISNERSAHFCSVNDGTLSVFYGARNDAVSWICRVSKLYGFAALTTVLAVNYFDRFVSSVQFQRDKPWMTQLAAVACLSLAAKMEEIQVPLLLDLQVEEATFMFEAKTVQRMELLVLSTLEWRMNPVTPISFFQQIVARLGLNSPFNWEFLYRCERVLLCVIVDSKVVSYLPSILAAAIMIHVIKEIEPLDATEYRNQLLDLLKINEEQVNECHKLMLKPLVCCKGISSLHENRKHLCEPSSPGGVIDASFSCDNSNDSWTVAPSVSLSVEPVTKRSKTQEQQMGLPSVNRVSSNVLNSPCE